MAFEKAKPEPGIKAKLLDDRVRGNNDFIQPALDNDHDFTDAVAANQTGKHKTLHMKEQASPGASASDEANLAAVDSGTQPELEFTSEDGNAKIITDEGKINNVFADMVNVSIDEDDMVSDSATHLPTQQSVKAYADERCPVGTVNMYAGASEPSGWKICNAQLLDNSGGEFDALWAAFGSSTALYGGTGQTSFNVPDMRGRVPIGIGTGDADDATAHTLGDKEEGTETHVLLEAELAEHTHTTEISPNSSVGTDRALGTGSNVGTVTNPTSPIGSNTAHNNLQPSLGLNFIIKY